MLITYRIIGIGMITETGLYYLNSRYYNPEWGRFINADGIVGIARALLSHNMFAYSLNNPINNYDPSGFLCSSALDGASSIKKDITTLFIANAVLLNTKSPNGGDDKDKKKFQLRGTYSTELTLSLAAWLGGSVSIGVSFDFHGNIAIQTTETLGDASPNLSLTRYKTITNAPTVNKLEGLSHMTGFSASILEIISVGKDYSLIPDNETGGYYFGTTTNQGVGAKFPVPGEVHMYQPGLTQT